MKNNPQFVPVNSQTKVEFLFHYQSEHLINRSTYRARFITSSALHLAEAGEWEVQVKGEAVVVSFPRGRILDPQNRPWVTELLSIVPAEIVIPYDYPVSVSALGANPRYYVRFPRACSLTFESVISIDAKPKQKVA